MEAHEIKATKRSPYVLLEYVKGNIIIKGRSFVESPYEFYLNLTDKLKNFKVCEVDVEIYFDYCNTVSTKHLLEFLKKIKEKFGVFNMKWFYDEGDFDMKDTGEMFSSALKTDFEFVIK